jgi:Arc/MetJ-type ribon-helix-helix transcriptional regulator
MTLQLTEKVEAMVNQAVAQGQYSSPEEFVEAALMYLEGIDAEELKFTPEAEARIAEGWDQAARGEGRDWREVTAEMRARIRRP